MTCHVDQLISLLFSILLTKTIVANPTYFLPGVETVLQTGFTEQYLKDFKTVVSTVNNTLTLKSKFGFSKKRRMSRLKYLSCFYPSSSYICNYNVLSGGNVASRGFGGKTFKRQTINDRQTYYLILNDNRQTY